MSEALSATTALSPPAEQAGARRAASAAGKSAFLQAVQDASRPAPRPPDVPELVPHPFYEGEMYDPKAAAEFWGKDGLGFGDFVDIINPLHHIPIVASIYRKLTGDEISPASRLAGGALFGGPFGLAGAYVTGVIEDATGKDIGETILAMITGEDGPAPPDHVADQVASIAPAAGNVDEPAPDSLIAWTTPRILNTTTESALARPTDTAISASTMGESIAWSTPRMLGDAGAPNGAVPTPPAFQTAQLATARPGAGPGVNPVDLLLPERQPSPLAFARSLLETTPSGGIPTPPPAATRSIIAAEERQRQAEKAMPDPVSAVLTARSQVPRSGTVRGLDARRALPDLATAHTPVSAEPLSPPARGVEDEPYVPGKRGAPPTRQSASALEAARRRAAAAPVPNSMVPKAMMNALEKYETMVQKRNAAEPASASGLTL